MMYKHRVHMPPDTAQLASTICEKYKDAVAARAQHVAEFISYEDALRVDHLGALHQWRAMVITWESDCTKPNPFVPTLRREYA